jgi:RNA polymerase-binding transcription factor DksA
MRRVSPELLQALHEAMLNRRSAIERQGPALTAAERSEIEAIDAALRRIEKGSYGQCVLCGAAIGRQRLRAVPEVRHCLTCADE